MSRDGVDLRPDPSRPIGLVLSGGGARGAFQVGVWSILETELGERPAVVSGTSAGAINGALIAAGLSADAMLEFWLGLADDPPVVANADFFRSLEQTLGRVLLHEPTRPWRRRRRAARILAALVRKHALTRSSGLLALLTEFTLTARFDTVSRVLDGIGTTHLVSTAPLHARIEAAVGGPAIRAAGTRLAINTIDVRNSPFRRDYGREISRLSGSSKRSAFKLGPEAMIAPLVHALESPNPRARYRVTVPTQVGAWLKRLLPTKMMDVVLLRQR